MEGLKELILNLIPMNGENTYTGEDGLLYLSAD